jgi:dipeptidyl aminopeptidase/acylaminoacyl peptidase
VPSPFEVEDLYQLISVEMPRLSPDGSRVAFIRVSADRGADGYRRAIYVVPADGSAPPRRFSAGTHSDHTPRWSPDGRALCFLSNRGGGADQLYLMPTDGGEARQLTFLPQGVSAPAWRPDGTAIAFLARVDEAERAALLRGERLDEPEDAWERARLKEQRERDERLRHDPRVITRLPYRSGTSFFDGRRYHIFLLALAEDEAPAPAPRLLTDGDLHYTEPVWMPDGSAVLTTATRDPEADSLFAYYDLLRVPVPASDAEPADIGQPERLTGHGYSIFDPLPSPDGRWIACRRAPDDNLLAKGCHVAVLPASPAEGDERERDLSSQTDINVDWIAWSPDSQSVLFLGGWRGDAHIHAASLEARAETLVDGGYLIAEADVGPTGEVAFVAGRPDNPCDLYLWRPDGGVTRLTQVNAPLLATRQSAEVEEVGYLAPDGEEVQGWMLRPPGYDASARYPLAVMIHGGPHVMWGPGFRSMWHEWQALAARGYVVFFCNPRGSDGYGERWRDAIHANWGVADAPDILAGIEAVKQRASINPEKICVTGGSYGGYMTTWLIAHSEQFCAAVSARGVYNLLTEHGTSDAHELIEFEFGGFPWELHEELWAHSPLAHAHRIATPLLILHSELDYRVPISEAEQLFSLLRRLKRPVEFVRYPREGHELTRTGEPRHRADHLRRTIEWFDRHTR